MGNPAKMELQRVKAANRELRKSSEGADTMALAQVIHLTYDVEKREVVETLEGGGVRTAKAGEAFLGRGQSFSLTFMDGWAPYYVAELFSYRFVDGTIADFEVRQRPHIFRLRNVAPWGPGAANKTAS